MAKKQPNYGRPETVKVLALIDKQLKLLGAIFTRTDDNDTSRSLLFTDQRTIQTNKLFCLPVIHDTWDEYVRLTQFGVTQLDRPRANSAIS